MEKKKILTAFETEINKIDDVATKPLTADSFYWLDQAISKFTKTRFNGSAPKFTSYEQNEKRTRDLHNLYVRYHVPSVSIDSITPDMTDSTNWGWYGSFYDRGSMVIGNTKFCIDAYVYPSDVMYVLNEDVILDDEEGAPVHNVSVFECTADNFMYRITNSLTDFHLHHGKARPLRIKAGKTSEGNQIVLLLNDGKYSVEDYFISYLRTPKKLSSSTILNEDFNDFEDDVWYEIIKLAAQMYVENQSEPRYRTLTDQVLSQE